MIAHSFYGRSLPVHPVESHVRETNNVNVKALSGLNALFIHITPVNLFEFN